MPVIVVVRGEKRSHMITGELKNKIDNLLCEILEYKKKLNGDAAGKDRQKL